MHNKPLLTIDFACECVDYNVKKRKNIYGTVLIFYLTKFSFSSSFHCIDFVIVLTLDFVK